MALTVTRQWKPRKLTASVYSFTEYHFVKYVRVQKETTLLLGSIKFFGRLLRISVRQRGQVKNLILM